MREELASQLHIVRSPGEAPISFDEWKEALRKIEGVRLSQVSASERQGDAEVFIPKYAEWIRAFSLLPTGSVEFQATPSPVLRIAVELAKALNAKIVDDAGKPYEP